MTKKPVKSTVCMYSFLPVLNDKYFYVQTYRLPLKSLTGQLRASQEHVFIYSSYYIVCISHEIVIATQILIIGH